MDDHLSICQRANEQHAGFHAPATYINVMFTMGFATMKAAITRFPYVPLFIMISL